jgi:transglutaminase-like putative cysteine protease
MARPASQPPRAARLLALAGLLLATLLNLQHLAWWCLPVLAGAAAWHARSALRGTALPGRIARVALVFALAAAVVLSVRGGGALAGAATLLASMTAAKLFEAHARRDWYVLLGGTLFLLLSACLDQQQLLRVPLYAACLWLCTGALRGLERSAQARAADLLRSSGRQLLVALPLAAVLFLFVPRLPGGFWSLPGSEAAITGLSDEMSPGAIARLAESFEPALRVRFAGAPPPPGERYWRGPVLHAFDGFTWRRGPSLPSSATPLEYIGPHYHYTMTLEPGQLPLVPALQYPEPPELPLLRYTSDYQLLLPRPLGQAQSFELDGWPQARSGAGLDARERRIDLHLPPGRNPRSTALAQQMRSTASDDAAVVHAALEHLRTGGYTYTLAPQPLGRDSVDGLLFDTREGFCGHYASAFVTLMRAAGIPARVVTGYLGGEWNRFGGYLTVRQAEAHAWAEVWLPDRGWTRVDPTAVVSPERLTRGNYDFGLSGVAGVGLQLRRTPWLGQAFMAWEAASAWWQDKVVGFNLARQMDLTRWLGLGEPDWQRLALMLGMGLGLWLAALAWGLGRELRARRPDELARAWLRIEERLARAGHRRAPGEAVASFNARVASLQPALGATLAPLVRQYLALRYGPPGEGGDLRQFVRAARAFPAGGGGGPGGA